MSTQTTLLETCRVLDDLKAMFATEDDPDLLARSMHNVTLAEEAWHRRRDEIASVVDALQRHITTLESEIAAYSDGRYDDDLAQIEHDKKRILGEIEALQSAKQNLQQKIEEVEQQDEIYRRESSKETSDIESENIVTRRMINLFSLISSIEWDFDAPKDVIKGTAFLKGIQQVKPFQFEAAADGSVPPNVIHSIWSMMWLNFPDQIED